MLHKEITGAILECSFEVSNELGAGFLESVYENALLIALDQKGIRAQSQVRLDVLFRGFKVGNFVADLVVEGRACRTEGTRQDTTGTQSLGHQLPESHGN